MVSGTEIARILYPPQDGGQPGNDRNAEARMAFKRGYEYAHSEGTPLQALEYGVKLLMRGHPNDSDVAQKRYTVPVGAYPTIAALREDWNIREGDVILVREKRADGGAAPWRTA